MLKLNRTSEYGLMALRQISRKQRENPGAVTSAREIADLYQLPFEITAKTLQRLKEAGVIQSAQGARGGYTLVRLLREISLADFLEAMEGPLAVVGCLTPAPTAVAAQSPAAPSSCEYEPRCEIRHMMDELNGRVVRFLGQIRLSEVVEGSDPLWFASAAIGAPASAVARATHEWGEP